MTFSVHEELYVIDRYDDADHRCIVATHTDIADVNQTVYVPRITTSLNDKKSGSKILFAEQNAHLTDTVNYYRFQPSTDYTIKGKLIDMETGDVLIDSKGNRVEKTVTVTSSATGTGEWAVDYEFDATELQGKVIVAYADVYVRERIEICKIPYPKKDCIIQGIKNMQNLLGWHNKGMILEKVAYFLMGAVP